MKIKIKLKDDTIIMLKDFTSVIIKDDSVAIGYPGRGSEIQFNRDDFSIFGGNAIYGYTNIQSFQCYINHSKIDSIVDNKEITFDTVYHMLKDMIRDANTWE